MHTTATPATIGVLASQPSERPRAAALAERLRLALVADAHPGPATLLVVTPSRLELRENAPRAKGEAAPGPVFIDTATLRRLSAARANYQQPLARALGVERLRKSLGRPVHVLDATAGLLHDSAIMLSFGCRVTAAERSPILAAMITDALGREALSEAFRFLPLDALAALACLNDDGDPPDVIYLDPMHPPRQGAREQTALVRKEMRALRAVVGDDPDSGDTLRALLAAAGAMRTIARVAVKLPLRAARLIDSPPPTTTHEGKSVRYDVYVPAR